MNSHKKIMLLSYASELASKIVAALAPGCERIEIAGSVRRCCGICGDIEIVAIPKHARHLFGEIAGSKLDPILAGLEQQGRLKGIKGGDRYKQYEFTKTEGVHLDLFLTTTSRWPVIFAIRTGSRDFSRSLATQKEKGGRLPNDCLMDDGYIWRNRQRVWLESEREFLELCGGWIAPKERNR